MPNDIGRMTRLCNLNLADNELTNLPMSIGLCQGLDRLGAGFNIDRNPITDEKMLKRFAVGTDHLCQYLANRLQAWEAHLKQEGRGKTVLSPWRGPCAPKSSGSNTGATAYSSSGGGGGARVDNTVRASVRKPSSEADKVAVLCNWASREIQTRVKPKVRELKQQLDSTNEMSEAAPLAKSIRALRQAVDVYCTLMTPVSKSPTPDMTGITDKLKVMLCL